MAYCSACSQSEAGVWSLCIPKDLFSWLFGVLSGVGFSDIVFNFHPILGIESNLCRQSDWVVTPPHWRSQIPREEHCTLWEIAIFGRNLLRSTRKWLTETDPKLRGSLCKSECETRADPKCWWSSDTSFWQCFQYFTWFFKEDFSKTSIFHSADFCIKFLYLKLFLRLQNFKKQEMPLLEL